MTDVPVKDQDVVARWASAVEQAGCISVTEFDGGASVGVELTQAVNGQDRRFAVRLRVPPVMIELMRSQMERGAYVVD